MCLHVLGSDGGREGGKGGECVLHVDCVVWLGLLGRWRWIAREVRVFVNDSDGVLE